MRLQEVVTSLNLPGGGAEDAGARIEILAKLSADGNGSGRGKATRGTRGRTPPRVAGFGLGPRGGPDEEGGGGVEPPPGIQGVMDQCRMLGVQQLRFEGLKQ